MFDIKADIRVQNCTTTLRQTPKWKVFAHSRTHQGLILMKGMGAQVKKTVMRRKDFLPQISDSAPIRGADRNDRKP